MAGIVSDWAPKDFIERAAQKSLQQLVDEYNGARFVLVVPISDPTSELGQGLMSSSKKDRGLAFRTLQGDAAALMTATVRRPTAPIRFLNHSWDVPGAYVPIPRHLQEAACYVVPICKRSGHSFLERVSVGRAHGHDIVLREPSVSKFHAWFEATEDGELFVGDAGSRNHLFANGVRVEERTRVQAGAKLRFGLLDTYVYTLESLWKALRS